MKIGITTYDLKNNEFQQQLFSMLKNKVHPDFIILHYSGLWNSFFKYFRFIRRTIKNYRYRCFSFIHHRNKTNINPSKERFVLSENDRKEVSDFLRTARIIKVKGINDKSTTKKLRKFGESMIVCNSGLINERTLRTPDIIFINIHASELPRYRGMNNVEWALLEDKDIYVTIHRISKDIDEGDILYQEKINTENINLSSIAEYRDFCFLKSNEAIGKAISMFIKNEIKFIPQDKKYEPLLQYYVMHPLLRKRLQEKLSASETL